MPRNNLSEAVHLRAALDAEQFIGGAPMREVLTWGVGIAVTGRLTNRSAEHQLIKIGMTEGELAKRHGG